MTVPVYQIDAFTSKPFSGNPAGVCLLSSMPQDEWMLDVAREMDLSETAFVVNEGEGFRLRWFTPKEEVDLCGHATLAAAHVLWQRGVLGEDAIVRFNTLSGRLIVRKQGDWIRLDFPVELALPCDLPDLLSDSLGTSPIFVAKNRMDYLVLVDSEEMVRNLKPDFAALAKIDARGTIVTASSGSKDFDFVSRFFAPAVGINEDPVTGSAHCCLGPFWSEHLDKKNMTAVQVSERGGVLKVEVASDRVLISGQAVTVLNGELLV